MKWVAPQPLVLASKSKARQNLLRAYGIEFETVSIDFDERAFENAQPSLRPDALACALAQAKAEKAQIKNPNRLILAADQVLVIEDQCLHQCATRDDALQQLARLSGKTHHLISAAVMIDEQGHQQLWQDKAEMQMRELTDQERETYFDLEGPQLLGSVGCYFYESHGQKLFSHVTGSLPVIMGLPLEGLKQNLIERGYLKP